MKKQFYLLVVLLMMSQLFSLPVDRTVAQSAVCPAAPASRFTVGAYGVVAPTPKSEGHLPLRIRERPTTKSVIAQTLDDGTPLHVTDGPTCADGYVWWKIDTATGSGWVAEGDSKSYFIDPAPTEDPILPISSRNCPDAPATRLTVGMYGVVLTTSTNNILNVHTQAGLQYAVAGTLRAGQQFQILNGAPCLNNSLWWQIKASDVTGWIMEGNAQSYTVAPVGVPIVKTAVAPPASTPDQSAYVTANVDPSINTSIEFYAWAPTSQLFGVLQKATPSTDRILTIFDMQGKVSSTIRLTNTADCTLNNNGASFDWAPDSQRLAILCQGQLLIIDLKGNKLASYPLDLVHTCNTCAVNLEEVSWSPDEQRLAYTYHIVGTDPNGQPVNVISVAVFDPDHGTLVKQLFTSDALYTYISYLMDGTLLVGTGKSGDPMDTITIYNADFSLRRRLALPGGADTLDAWALNGSILMSITTKTLVKVFDSEGETYLTLSSPQEVSSADVSADGQHLALAMSDGLHIYNLEGQQTGQIGPKYGDLDVLWSPNSQLLSAIRGTTLYFIPLPK
jgi:hypothetical protein